MKLINQRQADVAVIGEWLKSWPEVKYALKIPNSCLKLTRDPPMNVNFSEDFGNTLQIQILY